MLFVWIRMDESQDQLSYGSIRVAIIGCGSVAVLLMCCTVVWPICQCLRRHLGAGDEGDEEEEVPQSQSVSSKQANVSTVSWAKQGSLYSPSVGTVVQASGRGLRGTAFSVPELEAYDPAMYRTAASVAARAPQSTALPLADTPGSWTAGSRPPVGSKEAAARVASKSGTAGAFPLSGRQPHVQSSFDRSDFNTSWPQPSGARYPYS
mmetsp:Transcript_60577/g.109172  ORF Transcript_60577/g.109172 Transcript_60577/m.109172 type:complete len:207 (+) Transcript_60577:1-621(+)